VYDSPAGVSAALRHAGTGQIVEFDLGTEAEGQQQAEPVGLKAWVAAHKAARPGNAVLAKQVCVCGGGGGAWQGGVHRGRGCACSGLAALVCGAPLPA
jgi:hypothetical protein